MAPLSLILAKMAVEDRQGSPSLLDLLSEPVVGAEIFGLLQDATFRHQNLGDKLRRCCKTLRNLVSGPVL
jgi:hypothetical protein